MFYFKEGLGKETYTASPPRPATYVHPSVGQGKEEDVAL